MARKWYSPFAVSRLLLVSLLLLAAGNLFAQGPDSLWMRASGGAYVDEAGGIQQTPDLGYIIAGYLQPSPTDSGDVYLIRTDGDGNTTWTRTYGGSDCDRGQGVVQPATGGYAIVGYTRSFSIGGDYDVYLMKTDTDGDTLWTRTYGGIALDVGHSLDYTSDGGYIVAGATGSFGMGGSDFYVVKTNAYGDTLWTRTYGGLSWDCARSVQEVSGGGYIIAGGTRSFGLDSSDVYVVRADADGNTMWTKTYGGDDHDDGLWVEETADGGFIIAGYTRSFGAGGEDVYLIRTDADGDSLWMRTYGYTDDDRGESVEQTLDGGYVIAGRTTPPGGGPVNVYLVKTDSSGDTLWTATYGGAGDDYGTAVRQTYDTGYIVAGATESFGSGYRDAFLVKTDPFDTTIPKLDPMLEAAVYYYHLGELRDLALTIDIDTTHTPETVGIILEAMPGVTAAQIMDEIDSTYIHLVQPFTGYIMTGEVWADHLIDLAHSDLVNFVEASFICDDQLDTSSADVLTQDGRFLGINARKLQHPPAGTGIPEIDGSGIIVGVVDNSIDWDHGDFVAPGNWSRIAYLWDQRGTDPAVGAPGGYKLGDEWVKDDIDYGLDNTRPLGPAGKAPPVIARSHHGTHVTGIAAGDGSTAPQYKGIAPSADIIFVNTTMHRANIIKGVQYIFGKATLVIPPTPAVVNISLGSNYGPHDGTDGYELALSALTGGSRIVVTAAGNDRNDDIHAEDNAYPSITTFNIPAGFRTDRRGVVIIDIWYDGAARLNCNFACPGGNPPAFGVPVAPGNNPDSPPAGAPAAPGGTRVTVRNPGAAYANGDRRITIEIRGNPIVAGAWSFTLNRIAGPADTEYDAWICRSNGPEFTAHLDPAERITEPGNAAELITVASHTTKNLATWPPADALGGITYFSGDGPRRGQAVADKPNLSAPGCVVASAMHSDPDPLVVPPIPAHRITADGQHYYSRGTSMAAPHVTGGIAMMLQRNRAITPAFIRGRLAAGQFIQIDDATGDPPDPADWGVGKFDIGYDTDRDGLADLVEDANFDLAYASPPDMSDYSRRDTDDGLEPDGSEVQNGRDPKVGADDEVGYADGVILFSIEESGPPFSPHNMYATGHPFGAPPNPPPLNLADHGDIIGPGGWIFMTNAELLAAFLPQGPYTDFGLDALDVIQLDPPLVFFSTELPFFSGLLGVDVKAGDLLTNTGVVIRNSVLVEAFDPPPLGGGLDWGLDAADVIGISPPEFPMGPMVVETRPEFLAIFNEAGEMVLFSFEEFLPAEGANSFMVGPLAFNPLLIFQFVSEDDLLSTEGDLISTGEDGQPPGLALNGNLLEGFGASFDAILTAGLDAVDLPRVSFPPQIDNIAEGEESETGLITDGYTDEILFSTSIELPRMALPRGTQGDLFGDGGLGVPGARIVATNTVLTWKDEDYGLDGVDVVPFEIWAKVRGPDGDITPATYSVAQNYPNPFSTATAIRYALPTDCRVSLEIYSVTGRRVAVLVDEYQEAGIRTVRWDVSDARWGDLAAGVYFYRFKAGDFIKTQKMVLTR